MSRAAGCTVLGERIPSSAIDIMGWSMGQLARYNVPMPPHTDLSQLDRLYKGDRNRMARWVGIYLEEAPGQLERLVTCVERTDLEGLLAIVHDLKPTMHYLGAQRMQELLVRLAQEARTVGVAACGSVLQELMEEARSITSELERHFQVELRS
ncbi:MAG TPA: Hpt domain-containing protein [Flavobacteriales bacterium]|nr:Hpt domain-containing protein [Flavobacteriales bacterium]